MAFDPQEARTLAAKLDAFIYNHLGVERTAHRAATMLRAAVNELADLRAADHSDCNEALELRREEVIRLDEEIQELKLSLGASRAARDTLVERLIAAGKVVEAARDILSKIPETPFSLKRQVLVKALQKYDQEV